MIPASQIEQQSAEWHEFRKLGIGSSEIGSIMGVNKYQSLRKLWEIKTGLKEDEFEDNEYTRYGKHKEQYARREYEWQFNETGFEPCLFIHPKYSFIRGSFDAFNEAKGYGLEIKSPYFEKNLKAASEGMIDRKYYPQLQWLLLISNTKMIKYIVYDGHQTIWVKDVFADPQYQSRMLRYAKWFWNMVETKRDPKRRKLKHLKIFDQGVTDV